LAEDLGKDKNNDIYILSGDKDLYALITENVKIYDTMKRKVFNREEATLKF
jgi:5'-3' exonuclease